MKFLEEVSSALEGDAAARESDAQAAEAELVKAKSDADRLARALEAKLDVAMRRLEAGDDVAPPPGCAAFWLKKSNDILECVSHVWRTLTRIRGTLYPF